MAGQDDRTDGPSLSKDYQNFGDPIGLIRRMLGSWDRSAYAALARAGLAVGAIPLDRIWQRHERRLIENAPPSDRPVLLVTGGARTGSTFATQVLASQLEVDWLDNRAELFPRSPLTAMTRLRSDRARAADSSDAPAGSAPFASYYGKTSSFSAPNDAFFLWNRWLGADRYEARIPSDPQTRRDMRRFFDAWASVSPLPLLNKNNRGLPLVSALAEIIPQARFAILVRDALPTVASLVTARRVVHGDEKEPWGVLSRRDHADRDALGYVDDVCEQVAACTRAANDAADALGDRVARVRYEDLTTDPARVSEQIAQRFDIALRAKRPDVAVTRSQSATKLTPQERARAETVLDRLGLPSMRDAAG